MAIMRTHTQRGKGIINDLLQNFSLENISYADTLRNIVIAHHENIDGTGYPFGKVGNEIPLEARIVAVADIFDAHTSHRTYKQAWSNDEAFAALRKMAGVELDRDCVEALQAHQQEIEEIQRQFKESVFG